MLKWRRSHVSPTTRKDEVMKRTVVLGVALLFVLTACADSNRDLPTLKDSWIIAGITTERLGGTDFPLSYEVALSISGASGPAPDGVSVAVTIFYPASGAQQSMDILTVEGEAAFELVFEQPGTVDCTAKVGGTIADFVVAVVETGESTVT